MIAQPVPATREVPQVLVSAKLALLLPVTLIPLMLSALVPLLVRVVV